MNNRVELSPADQRRLARAGYAYISRAPFARRRDGKIVLTVDAKGRCNQLDSKRGLCTIYDARPRACAEFPPGSEGCLFARDVERGIFDGGRD